MPEPSKPWGEVKTSTKPSRSTTEANFGSEETLRSSLTASTSSAYKCARDALPQPPEMTAEDFARRKLKVDDHVPKVIERVLRDLYKNIAPGRPVSLISGKVEAVATSSGITIDVSIRGAGENQTQHSATEIGAI